MRVELSERRPDAYQRLVERVTIDGQRRREADHRLVRVLGEDAVGQEDECRFVRRHRHRIQFDADEEPASAHVADERGIDAPQFSQQIGPEVSSPGRGVSPFALSKIEK